MAAEPGPLDYWRKYFRSANSGIFEVIEHAILVAASDCPSEFRVRRDRIAEKLFSCQLPRCFGCDLVKQQSPEAEEEDGFRGGGDAGVSGYVDKESKVNSSIDEREEVAKWVSSSYSYVEAEALTEEIEEENQTVGEVLRIKGILVNKEDEPDALLFESLRRLQLMALSVEILKETEIGKAVNGLRKHGSRQIQQLVRTLIDGWKILVDDWVNATAALTVEESTPESVNPSIVEDEGLPSPPMDEGALFATHAPMELSQFFDGMDDDGNPHNHGEFDKCRESKPSMENLNRSMGRQRAAYEFAACDNKGQLRKQEIINGQSKTQETTNRQANSEELLSNQRKPQEELKKQNRQLEAFNKQNQQSGSIIASGRERPQKTSESRVTNDTTFQQRQEPSRINKKPSTCPQDKSKYSDEMSVRAKLEVAKRKLHEGYQQAENAKKQRTIRVMELQDLPKQGLNPQRPFLKPGNHTRHWAGGRR